MNAFYGYSQSRADNFKEDLEFLKINLPEKHVNLFAKISRSEFEKRVKLIESKIDTLDEESFMNEMQQLTVAIGDEHTRIESPDFFSYTLPIRFTIFKEGIFVTEVAQSSLLLTKLIEVNGVPIEKVVEQFKKIIPNDNMSFFETMLLFYINNTYTLKGMGITNSEEEISYTFKKADDTIVKAVLKLGSDAMMQKVTQFASLSAYSGEGNYWYEYNKEKNLIYFNYRNCKEDTNLPFEKFNTELFGAIASNKPDMLILDLRYNGGGNSKILDSFLKLLKGSYLNQTGKLYVLIGKMTFSSALLNAIDLKQNFNAILVGEPTAGSINHYGETLAFELPNTKTRVIYSTKYFEQWKGHDGALIPDIIVSYSIENFITSKDEALEAVGRL